MKQGWLQLGLFVLAIGLSSGVRAQDQVDNTLMPSFKFQKNDYLLNPGLSSNLDGPKSSKSETVMLSRPESNLRSYDAIFYYPLHRSGVSIDLGLNLRMQEDLSVPNGELPTTTEQDWLNVNPSETKTMVHAAAVFDLPFNGFKAGLSGTYTPDLNTVEYDYRAKLSYKWKSGLGLEGGWQHQQKSYEQQNINDTLDVQTLFLDMKYHF